MMVIEKYCLLAGQTFVSKEIVWMRIAEEANHRQIKFTTEISNLFNLYVSGDNFRVQVNFSKKNKWKVKLAAVRENLSLLRDKHHRNGGKVKNYTVLGAMGGESD